MRQFSRSFMAILLLGSILNALPLSARSRPSLSFIPPDDHVGEPSNTGGGGSRGEGCLGDRLQDDPPLTILAPQLPKRPTFDPRLNVLRGGLTTDSFPSLFVYLPKTHAKMGEFLLLERNTTRELYYSNKIALPEESGILHFSIPIGLEEGKTYEWYFSLICPESDDPELLRRYGITESSLYPAVAGEIKRISLSEELAVQMENASLETKIGLYGKAGLWYDFFALLTEGIPRSPQLQEAWQTSLIRDIDPDSPIFPAPFLSCCSLPPEGE
ncbi:MAG: DUF928 domain-containing protein [Cyanobacteria bacterium SBLK]|nr:DUF928 domain-containing protein [Cyanobacteria bacterium SBLK]